VSNELNELKKEKIGIIIIDHGSKSKEANLGLEKVRNISII
jgi:hypothetical protein